MTRNNFDLAYKKLNTAQREAVDTIEGPVMVLAGPGTGKTQVLAMRIGRILQETQVNPSNILCLTYTETGAFEMRSRLVELIDKDGYYVRVNTFHSFCNEVISDNPDRFINLSGHEPLDDVERIRLFQSLIDSLPATSVIRPFGEQYFYLKDLVSAIANLKRENISPDEFELVVEQIKKYVEETKGLFENYFAINAKQRTQANSLELKDKLNSIDLASFLKDYVNKIFETNLVEGSQTSLKDVLKKFFENTVDRSPKQEELIGLYKKYQDELVKNSRFDFEDLLIRVSQKFDEDEVLLGRYQEQFQYILVDEFQDTNGAQNKILKQLGSFYEDPNIFVVGDDDQSIYRFQGASLENILDFYHSYGKSAKIISLSENYRSTQLILDCANSLIQNNKTRVDRFIPNGVKNLHANIVGDDRISSYQFEWEREESYFVATEVKKIIDSGVEPKDIAVIYRNNNDSKDFVDLFLRLKIPFKLFAGKNILNETIVLQLIRLLKVIENVSLSDELFFLLHGEFLDFDPTDVAKINLCGKNHLFEKIGNKNLLKEATVGNIDKFVEFQRKLGEWQKLAVNKTFEDFFVDIISQSDLLNFVINHEEKVVLLNSVNTLFEEIKKLNKNNHKLSLSEFLQHIKILEENNLSIEENPLETDKNAVSLLTAHKSKGLEFSYVFITKLIDKKWGNTIDRTKLKLPLGLLTNQVIGQESANEDERRLFYVAMTRAKRKIYLTYSLKEESDKERIPSVFLTEVDEKFIDNKSQIDVGLPTYLTTTLSTVPTTVGVDKDYLRSLLKDYKLSVTHLNNYLECPRIWYYQNLLRVPAVKDKNASFGSAVHYALRDVFVNFYDGKTVETKTFINYFKSHLEREVLTESDFKSSLEYGQKHLADYFNFYLDKFIKLGKVEYDFSSHGINVDGVPITGKLDKLEIVSAKDKLINVVDYKTGNPDNVKRIENYKRQIVFYKLLCDTSPRFEYKMVSGELDYVQKSKKTGEFVKKKFEVTQVDLESLKEEIKTSYDEMINLKFLDFADERLCGKCEFCVRS